MKFFIIGIVVLAAGGVGAMFYFNKTDDAKKLGDKVGNELNDKATKLGKKVKVVGEKIGDEAAKTGKQVKVVGKNIGNKAVVVGKQIGDKSLELKDKTGDLIVKGKNSVVVGYDATKKKAHDMAMMNLCPLAYDNMKKCYPKKFAGIGKTKAVSKCSFAMVSGNAELEKGINCLVASKSDCKKVKKCINEKQMTALIAKIK